MQTQSEVDGCQTKSPIKEQSSAHKQGLNCDITKRAMKTKFIVSSSN
jgi:hypothetical protein